MSEELLHQLIHMVGESNRLLREMKEELREFKEEMYEFRDDTYRRLDSIDRHDKLMEADLDLLHRKVNDNEREIHRIKHAGQ
ncbi:hypothetical protein [uncultured Brevibacillus sp.]|uniref:hypothetical protein n=1 Tax=uncultured Brevibacillus sp. TaxID=169970 RepID=UPI002592E458|nr:hypothetical protein [uncultured Brevibacillus sp.]